MHRPVARALAVATLLALTAGCGAPAAPAPRAFVPPAISPEELETAPLLPFSPVRDALGYAADAGFGAASGVAFDSRGHLFVYKRGPRPLAEFDVHDRLVREFGEEHGIIRAHGLRIDAHDNLWITDVGGHTVTKLSPAGKVLLRLGTPGQAGRWDEAAGTHLLDQPNDIAFAPGGEFLVVQGHGRGEPRVLRFDADGRLITSWGGQGSHPGQFDLPHSIVVDAHGRVHVADRENRRVQVFRLDGRFIRQVPYAGLPCGLYLDGDQMWMVSGFAGQVLRLAPDGSVLAAAGRPGKRVGEFGEAHYLAIGPSGDIYVADPIHGDIEKFARD